MTQVTIEIILPSDRRHYGTLALIEDTGALLAGPFIAYGKADNAKAASEGNRIRDPLLEWGDTPNGEYAVSSIVKTGDETDYPARSYGPEAALTIDPVSGPALTAKENGRNGIYIHSGQCREDGSLRPTFGCVRLSNEDMSAVLHALRSVSGVQDSCAIPTASLFVRVRPPEEEAVL
ncbi:L,D-transpeptidase [Breoghania sp. L-A4]|uniref:L,D-transpeptidase n=1 Tax=Breoghania sp. L-A4 TaxID=2304600 RepID=UPI000E358325|nr:L,D-transpeptidase [Breoghania sp. L-A4]AXS40276.1 L,D-transpeptidase [Breoghania sp. L-A4]